MDWKTVVRQTQIEHETLGHVLEALRLALSWRIEETDFSRKLSSVRFIAQSFQRHLERLFELEEHDGYMSMVRQSRPELTSKIEQLAAEHDALRERLAAVMPRLERVAPTADAAFADICRELEAVLDAWREHEREETAVLTDAVTQDVGGEGGE